jgi:hypothetical protein
VLTASIVDLMMEAASMFETRVNFYHTLRRNIAEDSHLHTCRRENLKSHLVLFCVPEIAKVRSSLFQINGAKKDPLVLPDAEGTPTTLTEKVYVPVKEHPDVSNILLIIISMVGTPSRFVLPIVDVPSPNFNFE